jgi:segregation and condensation protein B
MRDLLEALLFLQSEPVPLAQLARWLNCDQTTVSQWLAELEIELRARGAGIQLDRVANGFQLVTRRDLAEPLAQALAEPSPRPLSAAGWEVLAIVAYKQPITRLEIEAIRQTNSERALETLLDRGLIEEAGRKEAPGRPILYVTSARFLREFGLNQLSDLPPLPDPQPAVDEGP